MGVEAIKNRRSSGHHWAAKCKIDFSKEFEEKGIPLEEDLDAANLRELNALGNFFGMEGNEVQSRCDGVMSFAAAALSSTTSRAQQELSPEAACLKAKGLLWKKVHARRARLEATPESIAVGENVEQSPRAEVAETLRLPVHAWSAPDPSTSLTQSPKSPKRSPPERSRGINFSDTLTPAGTVEHSMDSELPTQVKFAKRAQERIHRPVTPRELVEARPPAPLSITDFPPIFRRAIERPQETHYSYFTRRIPEERPELRKVMQKRAECTRRVFNGRETWLSTMECEPVRVRSATEPSTPSSVGRGKGVHAGRPEPASSLSPVSPSSPDGGRGLRNKDLLGSTLSPRSAGITTRPCVSLPATPRAGSAADTGAAAAGRRRNAALNNHGKG